eukprot:1159207-Pelagomonas_calceolata.AAC.7
MAKSPAVMPMMAAGITASTWELNAAAFERCHKDPPRPGKGLSITMQALMYFLPGHYPNGHGSRRFEAHHSTVQHSLRCKALCSLKRLMKLMYKIGEAVRGSKRMLRQQG